MIDSAAGALKATISRHSPTLWLGRLAQRESAAFTRQRSLVRSQYRPPDKPLDSGGFFVSGRAPIRPWRSQSCLDWLRLTANTRTRGCAVIQCPNGRIRFSYPQRPVRNMLKVAGEGLADRPRPPAPVSAVPLPNAASAPARSGTMWPSSASTPN